MVFPIVLIALLLTGLMIPPLMSMIGTSLVTGQLYENNSNELYAADAGVMDATWLLQELHVGVEELKDSDITPERQGEIEEAMVGLFCRYDPDITHEQIDRARTSLFTLIFELILAGAMIIGAIYLRVRQLHEIAKN